MLNHPLVTPGKLKRYLSDTYGLTENTKTFVEHNPAISEIPLNHTFNSLPHVLYHDRQFNPGETSPWDIALSLHESSFLTGYTAMSLYGWTEYQPRVIYVNWVRTTPRTHVSQTVDNETLQKVAFRPKRQVKTRLPYKDREIIALTGQSFHRRELSEIVECAFDGLVPRYAKIMSMERLFIEAVVNYHYFGGADIVWEALTRSASEIDAEKLIELYDEIGFLYPYSNALGYVLERSGVANAVVADWAKLVNRDLRFHLFLGDTERRHWIDRWSLYVPERFYKDHT